MRSLFIDRKEAVTQGEGTINDAKSPIDKKLFSKYANIKSNVPVICPVVSTTSYPLSEDESINTDKEDDKFSYPLYYRGYKNVDYDSSDGHISKKCKLSNRY